MERNEPVCSERIQQGETVCRVDIRRAALRTGLLVAGVMIVLYCTFGTMMAKRGLFLNGISSESEYRAMLQQYHQTGQWLEQGRHRQQ